MVLHTLEDGARLNSSKQVVLLVTFFFVLPLKICFLIRLLFEKHKALISGVQPWVSGS
jgi:hypothetical protein